MDQQLILTLSKFFAFHYFNQIPYFPKYCTDAHLKIYRHYSLGLLDAVLNTVVDNKQ
jgi:hypothetical protein